TTLFRSLSPVVRSSMCTSSASPPPESAESKMWTVIVSPGFISSVCSFGVNVEIVETCGPAGPVGTPSFWMKAKLVGSSQAVLQWPKCNVHSRSLMWSEAHQCELSQLMLSKNGASPGG